MPKGAGRAAQAWTPEEDEALVEAVAVHGHGRWADIAGLVRAVAGTARTGKQCRERFVNHLDPRLDTSEWSLGDDQELIDAVELVRGSGAAACGKRRAQSHQLSHGRARPAQTPHPALPPPLPPSAAGG